MPVADYFNLRRSYPFYGAYHKNTVNKLIHIIGVPTIFTTALAICYPIRYQHVGISLVAASFYAVSFIVMDPVAGILYAPVIGAMYTLAATTLQQHPLVTIGVHVAAWIAQFVGHGVYEKRKPALFDSFFQSIHAAVFFVWLEVLFAFGYRPKLHEELTVLVDKQIEKSKSA